MSPLPTTTLPHPVRPPPPPPPPILSLFSPLCRSWQANLNLFHCDMTQQLHCSSGASPLGAPATSASSSPSASRQPAPRALALHASSWGFSDCFVQKNSRLCYYKSVRCPSSSSGACCHFFLHIQLPLKCMLDCGVTLLSPPSRRALRREGANTAASAQASDTANVCSFKSKCNQGWLMEMQSGIDLALMGLQPTGLRGSELCLEGSMYHW